MIDHKDTQEIAETGGSRSVEVSGNRLGMEYFNAGSYFPLANIFGEDASYLGGDKFTAVYFTTESGNMYLIRENPLDLSGEIISANESKKQGRSHVRQINRDILSHLRISVDVPFYYPNSEGKASNTTRVKKITAVNTGRIYAPDYLKGMGLQKSTVIEDFNAACQPVPTK